jgi:2-polyprenyl-3-methyl-5-hydroxy-6-metoxy-1,4-benzoquinol methylase
LRAQKAPTISYSLDKAREYWQYAPNSIGSTKKTTRELLNKSDDYLRKFVWQSIEARNTKEGAMAYRTKVLKWIIEREVKSLLDFGCGTGQDGVYFATKCPHTMKVTFADIVESNIKLVSSYARIFNIHSNAMLIENPETDNFSEDYDMILANGVLHHTPRARQTVMNLKRYLKPNGLFVCMLYTPEHFKSTHARNLREYAFLSEGRLPKSTKSTFNPYSDSYDKAKAEKLFEDFRLLDHFTTCRGGFGWYVLIPSVEMKLTMACNNQKSYLDTEKL